MTSRNGMGIAAALAAARLYGLVPNFVRGAFLNGVPRVESTFFRASLIAIALFAFAGLALAVGPSFDTLDPRGILLATAAALFCTVQFFSGRAISHYMTPAAFGALVHVTIWPATLLVAVVAGGGTLHFLPG